MSFISKQSSPAGPPLSGWVLFQSLKSPGSRTSIVLNHLNSPSLNLSDAPSQNSEVIKILNTTLLAFAAKYSRTSLSRTRLFRITAYLEVKIWSLFQHETMTTGNKLMWKRGEIAPEEQFILFSTLFYIYISNFRSQITYSFVKCGCSIYCFPHSLNSDMSRYGYLEVFQWIPWNSR